MAPLCDPEKLAASLSARGHGAETVAELLDVAERTEPDVVIVGNDGSCNVVWLVAQINAVAPQTAAVVVFERPDDVELLALLHAGAVGYLPMSISPERLCAAIGAASVR